MKIFDEIYLYLNKELIIISINIMYVRMKRVVVVFLILKFGSVKIFFYIFIYRMWYLFMRLYTIYVFFVVMELMFWLKKDFFI